MRVLSLRMPGRRQPPQRGVAVAKCPETRNAGTITLSEFSTVAFNAPLQYTDAGGGLTSMTFECPGVSSTASLTPQLVFSRAP